MLLTSGLWFVVADLQMVLFGGPRELSTQIHLPRRYR